MGLFHCVSSDCATVWVKKKRKKITTSVRGTHVKYSNRNMLAPNYFEADSFFTTVEATHYTIEHGAAIQDPRCIMPKYPNNTLPLEINQELLDYYKSINPSTNLIDVPINYQKMSVGDEIIGDRCSFGAGRTLIKFDGQTIFRGYADAYLFTKVNSANPTNSYLHPGEQLRLYLQTGCTHKLIWISPDNASGYLNSFFDDTIPDPYADEIDPFDSYLILHNTPVGDIRKRFGFRNPLTYLEILNPTTSQVEKDDGYIWEKYQFEKTPYLERLEIVDFKYVRFGLNINLVPSPPECLNIYVNNIAESVGIKGLPLLTSNVFTLENNFRLQFCGEPGDAEPPEYFVVCDCKKDCPDNTCAVECGDHICCYDSNGVSVLEIPKENNELS